MKIIVSLAMATLVFAAAAIADEQKEALQGALSELTSAAVSGDALTATQAKGVYLWSSGGRDHYVALVDGHLFVGEVYDLGQQKTLREISTQAALKDVLNAMPPEELIVFPAADYQRHMTVFTDIDCGYCRRLHAEVPLLTAGGLEVRYAAFPRAGIGSASYDKIVTVWCSEDQRDAMTRSKLGERLEDLSCANPVAEHYAAGSEAGISGTPTLVMDDGTVIGGYIPAEELLARLGLAAN